MQPDGWFRLSSQSWVEGVLTYSHLFLEAGGSGRDGVAFCASPAQLGNKESLGPFSVGYTYTHTHPAGIRVPI